LNYVGAYTRGASAGSVGGRVVDVVVDVGRAITGANTPNNTVRPLTPQEAARIIPDAPRTYTALTHTDVYHRAGSFLTESQLARGQTSLVVSGDGVVGRTRLTVEGEINGVPGTFDFIIDIDGSVMHQQFHRGFLAK